MIRSFLHQHNYLLGAIVYGAAVFLLSLGCTPIDDFDQYDCEGTPASVYGVWTITGKGVWDSCEDEDLNGSEFKIESLELDIAQDRDTFSLARELSLPNGLFSLQDASVLGQCINFTTVETGDFGGMTIKWRAGQNQSTQKIKGTFTVQGPNSCSGTGDFALTIDR